MSKALKKKRWKIRTSTWISGLRTQELSSIHKKLITVVTPGEILERTYEGGQKVKGTFSWCVYHTIYRYIYLIFQVNKHIIIWRCRVKYLAQKTCKVEKKESILGRWICIWAHLLMGERSWATGFQISAFGFWKETSMTSSSDSREEADSFCQTPLDLVVGLAGFGDWDAENQVTGRLRTRWVWVDVL